ncbi:uncharacterized protein [Lepeophtheirus salmonis]|uniref:uncharacterized protein n=1 Tax=Lepeophtheirus salmonis TaxID=72036 RepID=UPI001AE61EA2|nr:extensin-2-like [Lepeophtheirus salmonis]
MKIFLGLLALLAVALADHSPAQIYSPPPTYKPAPAPVYPDTPPRYKYRYAAKDDYEGLYFNADESRDGYATNGVYSVLLPDGRVKTVTYNVADAYSGFVADVTYSKPPPDYKPAPPSLSYKPSPSPSYKPAPPSPAYKPAPPPPSYKPVLLPVHKPAPPPVYKPAPSPVYTPSPIPSYKPTPSPIYYKPLPTPAYKPAPAYSA